MNILSHKHFARVFFIITLLSVPRCFGQGLQPGHYVGYATNQPWPTALELFVGSEGIIAAKFGPEVTTRVVARRTGSLLVNFSKGTRFRGEIAPNGASSSGELSLSDPESDQRHRNLQFYLTPTFEPTLTRLTGMRMWWAVSDANTFAPNYDGTFSANFGQFWDTQWEGNAFNIYLATGTVDSPFFINSGNANVTLNPNLPLHVGSQTVLFSGEFNFEGILGINLYFDDSPTNRISAKVATDGTSNFSVIDSGVPTFGTTLIGWDASPVPSAGTLSFISDGLEITLTDLHVVLPRVNLVGPIENVPADEHTDTTGSFTLTVIPQAWRDLR
jgi:hypothetical protein